MMEILAVPVKDYFARTALMSLLKTAPVAKINPSTLLIGKEI